MEELVRASGQGIEMHGGGHWRKRGKWHSFQRFAVRIRKDPSAFSGMEIRHEAGKSSYSPYPRVSADLERRNVLT
jgi:hypothetical protein